MKRPTRSPKPSLREQVHDAMRRPKRVLKGSGLYKKFNVTRTDGMSRRGGKHYGCAYFVLDLTCDPHAPPAIAAYAKSCRRTHPQLSLDLRSWLKSVPVSAKKGRR